MKVKSMKKKEIKKTKTRTKKKIELTANEFETILEDIYSMRMELIDLKKELSEKADLNRLSQLEKRIIALEKESRDRILRSLKAGIEKSAR